MPTTIYRYGELSQTRRKPFHSRNVSAASSSLIATATVYISKTGESRSRIVILAMSCLAHCGRQTFLRSSLSHSGSLNCLHKVLP